MRIIDSAKNPLKKIFYKIYEETLPRGTQIKLGYIFHTEAIYDRSLFDQLVGFLKAYTKLTGKRAICTMITPENPLVQHGMKTHSVSPEEFIDRTRVLNDLSRLGYHGHYFFDNSDFLIPESQIGTNSFFAPAVERQFSNEVSWFEKNGLSHNGLYSAGWWFMNEYVQSLLIKNDFRYDFSLSRAPWFRDQYSWEFMKKHGIRTAELTRVRSHSKSMICVQNLIGCHLTEFNEDFIRNLKPLLDPGFLTGVAVTNSHDYDLAPRTTLSCIEFLMNTGFFSMIDDSDLDSITRQFQPKEVALMT